MTSPQATLFQRRFLLSNWEWVLFGLCVFVAMPLSRGYGMAWDEAQHAIYGSYVWDYFRSGFQDMKWKTDIGGLYTYGTLFDLPSAIFHRTFADDLFEWRSFFMAAAGAFAIPAVAKIGRRLGGERVAIFSVASLLMMPQFVGQSFINCKDIPLATGVAWSVLGILMALEKPVLSRFCLLGVIFGLTLSVRVGGAMVGVFFVAGLIFCGVRSALRGSLAADIKRSVTRRTAIGFVLTGLLTWTILVAFWPYAHQRPFWNPIESFLQATAFPISYPVQYMGQNIGSAQLPWHYLPVMLFLTAPVFIALWVAVGLGIGVRSLWKQGREAGSERIFVILFWLIFPVVFVWIKKPNVYDGVRHFLFVLPAMALLAGLGAASAAAWLDRRKDLVGTVGAAATLALAAPDLITLHPYQYVFYNVFAGDRQTLHERFETDYWATSYREVAKRLNREQTRAMRPLTVAVGLNELSASCFSHFAAKDMRVGLILGPAPGATLPAEVDYYTAIPRYQMWKNFPTMPLYMEIRRNGVLLNTVRGREPSTP
jgi:4-amino-4-deoxy-L-arabinose transferase-like glycosyltransferase